LNFLSQLKPVLVNKQGQEAMHSINNFKWKKQKVKKENSIKKERTFIW